MQEKGKRGPKLIGDVLREVMRTAPWARRGDHRKLVEAWFRAAGEEVARRTRVVGVSRGTLTVNFESAALRHEIEAFRKGEILSKLRETFPAKRIASLKCVLRS